MKDGEREQPIENYGKKEQKEWLDNILPDPHPCTAGNKEEEHIVCWSNRIVLVYVATRCLLFSHKLHHKLEFKFALLRNVDCVQILYNKGQAINTSIGKFIY